MAIDPEVISFSHNKVSRKGGYFPKWVIYGAGGVSVLLIVSLIKSFLPLIGMGLLMAYILSQSKTKRRF